MSHGGIFVMIVSENINFNSAEPPHSKISLLERRMELDEAIWRSGRIKDDS